VEYVTTPRRRLLVLPAVLRPEILLTGMRGLLAEYVRVFGTAEGSDKLTTLPRLRITLDETCATVSMWGLKYANPAK
jgi:hypothetical protein